VAPIDNEYVRRVGFALSLSSNSARESRLNPLAWLSGLVAVIFVATALLAFAMLYRQ
jgi:hypothetical protein